jgi:hypothetical protein
MSQMPEVVLTHSWSVLTTYSELRMHMGKSSPEAKQRMQCMHNNSITCGSLGTPEHRLHYTASSVVPLRTNAYEEIADHLPTRVSLGGKEPIPFGRNFRPEIVVHKFSDGFQLQREADQRNQAGAGKEQAERQEYSAHPTLMPIAFDVEVHEAITCHHALTHRDGP